MCCSSWEIGVDPGLAHVQEQFSQSTESGEVNPGLALGEKQFKTHHSTVQSIASCLVTPLAIK